MIALRLAAILRLLASGCPAAIIRRVRSVVVDALDGVLRRALAHVGDEDVNIGAPAIAHGDAARSVPLVIEMSWIRAAGHHRAPLCIHARSGAAVSSRAAHDVAVKASATPRHAGLQVAGADVHDAPALAAAFPLGSVSATLPRNTRQNHESAERLADERVIMLARHGSIFSRGAL